MLRTFNQFGGIIPRITDPRLIPAGKSQAAVNCRFDHGGVAPLGTDTTITTPSKSGSGTLLSIYLYNSAGTGYWFTWLTDVDAVLTPTANDSYKRVYFTEAGVLKVTDSSKAITGGTDYPEDYLLPSPPAPTAPLVATLIAVTPTAGPGTVSNDAGGNILTGVGTTFTLYGVGDSLTIGGQTVQILSVSDDLRLVTNQVIVSANSTASYTHSAYIDPTLTESRVYTYTYVNSYGDEGPPCSTLSNEIQWTPGATVSLTTTETVPGGKYGLTYIRIYRTQLDASGNSQYQFVEQVSVASIGAISDDTVADSALGEILRTEEWDGAPTGVTGLIPLPNEGLACYVGNTLCLSVPGFPHAWPVAWQKSTEKPIMGLCAWETTVVALTTGLPEAVTFTDPANSVPSKPPIGWACSSKRSVVDMGGYWMYASAYGMIAIGQGVNKIASEKLFAKEDWAAYAPDTIFGYLWQGKYVGFYTSGYKQAGFIYDPGGDNFVNLDFYATAGYHDPVTGNLYLQVGTHIVSFATETGSPRTMDILSHRDSFQFGTFTCIKVLATAYPVIIDIVYPFTLNGAGAIVPQTTTVTVTSKKAQRIFPTEQLIDAVDVRAYGTKDITTIYLASDLEELPQ